ncbi:MAG: GerMN domain-containing protein [Clostridia bacterium]|nr:GerMN domain-containing protein [Clostridia bacterium]
MIRNRKKSALLLLILCALCLSACAISPPDSLKRGGVDSHSLISASTAELAPDEKQIALYFRFQDSSFLAAEPRTVVVQRNENLEKAIVRALISGPLNTELTPLFPMGSEVVDAATQDGTLFITMNEGFLGRYSDEPGDAASGYWKTEGPARRQLCLDALAATLTEAGLCDRVQVMVQRNSGQAVSMRLQAGFLNRSGDPALLPPAVRDESVLLTPHNTAECVLNAWLRQDWDTLSLFCAHAPGEQSLFEAFEAAGVLVGYDLSSGSVAYDGQRAVLTADLTLRGQAKDAEITGYPLHLIREEGLWKMDYQALLSMMQAKE